MTESLEKIAAINTKLKDGSYKEVRLKLPHWGKGILFSSVVDALSKELKNGFNKNTDLAWYTRAAEGGLGGAASSFFILLFKNLERFEEVCALKQLKVGKFSLEICCALADSPPPKSDALNTVIVVDGLVPCLFEGNIFLHEISKYADFELNDINLSRDNTGKATIIVSKVKAFLPLALTFVNKVGHTHTVSVKVVNYKSEHKDLGSVPLEPSIELDIDDPEWKYSSGARVVDSFKPLSCTYCKQIGHQNSIKGPCP